MGFTMTNIKKLHSTVTRALRAYRRVVGIRILEIGSMKAAQSDQNHGVPWQTSGSFSQQAPVLP